MTRLNWAAVGGRFYELGVDRGVLYVDGAGHAWPGLISVTESPSGGEPKAHYIDGYKYANVAAAEEFEATITAFSSPPEFAACDGVGLLHNGLMATQQRRKPFGFSYRTLIGNDLKGSDHGYKIHLVYNALAASASRANNTVGQIAAPGTLSWNITTLAPAITGLRPTAHFVIDSRTTPRGLLAHIEDILYGSDIAEPRLPTVTELVSMFQSEGPIVRRNSFTSPRGSIKRWNKPTSSSFTTVNEALVATVGGLSALNNASFIWGIGVNRLIAPASEGDVWTLTCDVTPTFTTSDTTKFEIGVRGVRDEVYMTTQKIVSFDLVAGVTTKITVTTDPLGPNTAFVGIPITVRLAEASASVAIANVLLEKTDQSLSYFDAFTPDEDGRYYGWEGIPEDSASILRTWH